MGENVYRTDLPVLQAGDRTFVVPSMLRRFVAHLLDFGAAAAVAGFIFWLLPIPSPIRDLGGDDGFWGTVVPLLVYYLIIALYRPVMHAAAGATVGKMLLRMRLIGAGGVCAQDRMGRKPSFGLCVLRWLIFYIMPLGPFICLVVAMGSRHNRGFHDMVAGTAVVSTLSLPTPEPAEPDGTVAA